MVRIEWEVMMVNVYGGGEGKGFLVRMDKLWKLMCM